MRRKTNARYALPGIVLPQPSGLSLPAILDIDGITTRLITGRANLLVGRAISVGG